MFFISPELSGTANRAQRFAHAREAAAVESAEVLGLALKGELVGDLTEDERERLENLDVGVLHPVRINRFLRRLSLAIVREFETGAVAKLLERVRAYWALARLLAGDERRVEHLDQPARQSPPTDLVFIRSAIVRHGPPVASFDVSFVERMSLAA